MSNITLNIVEPGGPTPDPVVPNTGLFTHGIGGPEATIITVVSAVLLLTIVAVVVAMLYKKHKKQGKTTKLVSTVDACAAVVKSKKRVSAGLAVIALLVSAGTFAALLVNAGKSNADATEGEDGLTLDVSSEDLTIEVGDEPVFAALPVELTVEEATQAGYTLTAFTDSTDLVSTTDGSKVIPMVAADEGELIALAEDTYGLSLTKPASQDNEVYTALSTNQDTPTVIKSIDDYSETPAEDKTTIYYGFYITPDIPKGTYEGSVINYEAEPNYITNLSFNGNGNDGGVDMEGMTIIAGDIITLPQNTYTKEGYNFTGWNTNQEGTGDSYADEAEFTASLGQFEDVILYAQWEEPCPANNICYRANGADGITTMGNQTADDNGDPLTTGSNVTLWASNYSYTGHGFAGWSTDKTAVSKINDTSDKPIIFGPNQTITTGDLSQEGMELYAVWLAPATSASTLQSFTCPSDDAMPIGNVVALKDKRDNEVYTVAKLADGNCWMVENLRLADTHKEGGGTVPTVIANSNTHNPASGFTVLTASSDEWCDQSTQECVDQNKFNADNTADAVASMTQADSNVYSYGNYYNWYSATAGNGKFDTSRDISVEGDICPAGWALPYGGNSTSAGGGGADGGFAYLDKALNGDVTGVIASNNLRSFPNNFVYSGYWEDLSANDRSNNGLYWSSTSHNYGDDYAFQLNLSRSSMGSGSSQLKRTGRSVRCVVLGQ